MAFTTTRQTSLHLNLKNLSLQNQVVEQQFQNYWITNVMDLNDAELHADHVVAFLLADINAIREQHHAK